MTESLQEYLATIEHLRELINKTQTNLDFAVATIKISANKCPPGCDCLLHRAYDFLTSSDKVKD